MKDLFRNKYLYIALGGLIVVGAAIFLFLTDFEVVNRVLGRESGATSTTNRIELTEDFFDRDFILTIDELLPEEEQEVIEFDVPSEINFPFALPIWERYPHWEGRATPAQLASRVDGGIIQDARVHLPSEALGFTSNPLHFFNEDGTLNDNYTSWTAESFQLFIGQIVPRLINPVFGQWLESQDAGAVDADTVNLFANALTPGALQSFVSNPASFPLFMGTELEVITPWIGRVTNSRVDFNITDDYEATVYLAVTYQASNTMGGPVTANQLIRFTVIRPSGDSLTSFQISEIVAADN